MNYGPHPEQSLKVSPKYQSIINAITSRCSGSASEKKHAGVCRKSIYDDPWSSCDTKYAAISGPVSEPFGKSPKVYCPRQRKHFGIGRIREHLDIVATRQFMRSSLVLQKLILSASGYKIAGQWCGIPKLFNPSKTSMTQVVSDSHTEIIFEMRQHYTPKTLKVSIIVDCLVSLS